MPASVYERLQLGAAILTVWEIAAPGLVTICSIAIWNNGSFNANWMTSSGKQWPKANQEGWMMVNSPGSIFWRFRYSNQNEHQCFAWY